MGGIGGGAGARLPTPCGGPPSTGPTLTRPRPTPCSADVWAAGVFLCVTLLGAFPFDHSAEARLNLADAELDLWMQEVGRRWSESPFLTLNVGALPDDARDLLDRIFEVDPAKRVTVDGIAKHPWVAKPLKDPDLQAALEQQEAAQAAVDVHVRHRRIDQAREAGTGVVGGWWLYSRATLLPAARRPSPPTPLSPSIEKTCGPNGGAHGPGGGRLDGG